MLFVSALGNFEEFNVNVIFKTNKLTFRSNNFYIKETEFDGNIEGNANRESQPTQ